jgi:predicted acylesterase/phospholipase RssA
MTDPRRALILAGGGLKVAFQAGVLQVWLDEAGLKFDLADGCSGGCLNLALYCQGRTGTEMADTWRRYHPLSSFDLNTRALLKLGYADSIFEMDRMRDVFAGWGLDWDVIRASPHEATFNAYNFSRHELAVWTPDQMDEDRLIASISLPMWFPPVVINNETHIDSVFITDANLEEAIRRGADELWVIWTVSQLDEWHAGFVPHYFQIIEMSANGHFRRVLQRIERNNAAIDAGDAGEFGRPVTLRLLQSEVDMHYLINLTRDRVAEAVNAGVLAARAWCATQGIPLKQGRPDISVDIHEAHTELQFTEEMKGFVARGETDPLTGFHKGRDARSDLMFRLTIDVQGVNRFVTRPDHEASAHGWVQGAAVNGRQPVVDGKFNLFVDDGDPRVRYMRYRLHIGGDQVLTLLGEKVVKDDPGWDVWTDTTTLFTRLVRGHVERGDADLDVIAAGILRIHIQDFMRQMTTFRTVGPTLADRSAALARFGRVFLGSLWDIYAREILS